MFTALRFSAIVRFSARNKCYASRFFVDNFGGFVDNFVENVDNSRLLPVLSFSTSRFGSLFNAFFRFSEPPKTIFFKLRAMKPRFALFPADVLIDNRIYG